MRSGPRCRMIALVKHDIRDATPVRGSSAWARAFAVVYDPFLWAGERAGARALRKELVGQARGFTVEIGSGTGLNLPYYPDHLDELVLTEPDRSSPGAHRSERVMSEPRTRVLDPAAPANASSAARVRVGLFADALEPTDGDPDRLRATLGHVADAGVDHLCVGDHVSFFVGAGSDGLISATSLLAVQAALRVYVGVYLLPLRHPVTVARQLATIA